MKYEHDDTTSENTQIVCLVAIDLIACSKLIWFDCVHVRDGLDIKSINGAKRCIGLSKV